MTIRFGTLRHTQDLARALGTLPEDLEALVAANPADYYHQIRIPKRGRKRAGQYRIVYKVRQALAIVQKNVADAIAQATAFDECVQGFVHKRSIGSNARVHLGQKQLLHADIHHFFESVTTDQVRATFVSLGCNDDVAAMLTKICTYEGRLPEGSSSSPVIANLVARGLDADMKTLANASGCRYTRYADDMTFSGDDLPDPKQVEALLTKNGFTLRDGQCWTQHRGRSQFVTGVSIADPTQPRLPRRLKRQLRLALHYADTFGLVDHCKRSKKAGNPEREIKRLGGWVTFLYSIEGPKAAQWYYDTWKRVYDTWSAGPQQEQEQE
jgi:hypothetical protein